MLLPALCGSSCCSTLLPLAGSLSCSPSTSRAAVLVHVPALDWRGGTGAKARSPRLRPAYPVQRSKASRKPAESRPPAPAAATPRSEKKPQGREALPLLPRAGTFSFLPFGFNLKRAGEEKKSSESTLPIRA